MGLSLALNTARASLLATSSQIAVASRNVAGANDAAYARKIATLVTAGGSATVVISRASDDALFVRKLSAASASAEREALLGGLRSLAQTVGDTTDAASPASRLGALNAALQAAANQPDDADLARAAVSAAGALAGSLNAAAEAVSTVRADADTAMAASVSRINDLLGQFERANRAVIRGTARGGDVTDDLDDRDRILSQLSEEIGLTTAPAEGGGLSIYTDGGVPLFERTARTVAFTATAAFSAGVQGASVMIDGVPVTGAASPMPIGSGRLAGLAALRDEAAVQYQGQIDAVAGGLIDAFAESDGVAPDSGPRAGLFTAAGSGLPAAGPAGRQGLAARIRINAAVDPAQGGDVTLLRDGGMNGADYRDAGAGDAAYSGRLRALAAALGAERAFDPGGDLKGSATLADFAASSAGWLEARRRDASTGADYQKTLLGRASDALSNAVGVNGDDETALTLRLEQSYTASARLISVVNDLLKTLLDSVR